MSCFARGILKTEGNLNNTVELLKPWNFQEGKEIRKVQFDLESLKWCLSREITSPIIYNDDVIVVTRNEWISPIFGLQICIFHHSFWDLLTFLELQRFFFSKIARIKCHPTSFKIRPWLATQAAKHWGACGNAVLMPLNN